MLPTVERAADFEWRAEGEAAEVALFAPDAWTARVALGRALPASRLPGVASPLCVAAAPALPELEYGSVVVSGTHAAPDLASVPARGLLLVAGAPPGVLGVPPESVERLVRRSLSEIRIPSLSESGARALCERGALETAEAGLVEEEDLASLERAPGADPDALVRRALSAGVREWGSPGTVRARVVGEILDSGGAESLGLSAGDLVLVASVGAGDLGRLARLGHRRRILGRVFSGEFEAERDLPAAPAGTEEVRDLLAAAGAAANFADGRAALLVYTLRRALGELAGELRLGAAWRVGGLEASDGAFVHRHGLSPAPGGAAVLSGGSVAVGTGKMYGSSPPFAAPEVDGLHPWEEAGLMERWAELHPLEERD